MNKVMMSSMLAIGVAAGCGDSSRGNSIVGQVKRIKQVTPLICPDYVEVDLSLGVLRNGVGSTSREDAMLAIELSDHATIDVLTRAAKSGQIVHLAYNERRISPCWPDSRVVDAALEVPSVGSSTTVGAGEVSIPSSNAVAPASTKTSDGIGSDGR